MGFHRSGVNQFVEIQKLMALALTAGNLGHSTTQLLIKFCWGKRQSRMDSQITRSCRHNISMMRSLQLMHQLHDDFILFIYFLLKKGQTVFNNCNIRIQYLHYNLQKIKKKSVQSVVCAGRWEDPGRKIKI